MIVILTLLTLIPFSSGISGILDEEIPDYILKFGQPVNESIIRISRVNRIILKGLESLEPPAICTGEPPSRINLRNAIINESRRWYKTSGGKYAVLVHIDPEYGPNEVALIKESMEEIQKNTCLTFHVFPDPRALISNNLDYIHIFKGDGCFSYVGRRRWGRQQLSLAPGCVRKPTIIHELLHVIGLGHEHQRSDRDNYITIHWENIEPEFKYAFEKHDPNEFTSLGAGYDITSIMHYGHYTGSINGRQTITTKNGDPIRETDTFSQLDLYKIKRMYNCI